MRKSGPSKELRELSGEVKEARQAASGRDADWKALYEYYEGAGQRSAFSIDPKDEWIKAELRIANFVFAFVRTTVPKLLESAPRPYVMDIEGNLQDDVTDYLQAYHYARDIRSSLALALKDAVILGTGALKVYYDPTFEGQGDVRVSWQDPYSIFPDPQADSLDKCSFVAILNEYSEALAKELFPGDTKDKPSPYKRINLEAADRANVDSETSGAVGKPLVELWEVYHDFGRKLTIYTGDQELYSGPNPLGQRWPLALFWPDRDARKIWGASEIEQLKDPQNDINLLRLRFNIAARLGANPQVVVIGTPDTEVSNKPGEVYKFTDPEGKIEWRKPPDLPNDLWNMMQMNREALDVISGVHNVTRGQRPVGVQAGVAIQALQEAALTRPREIAKTISSALETVWQLVLECMQANYTDDRQLSYISGEGPQTGRVRVADLTEPAPPEGILTRFTRFIRGENGELVTKMLQVKVQAAGDLPLSQAQRADQAVRLSTVQFSPNSAIDRRALLEEVNFPNRQDVAERMEQAEQAFMQAQAGAAQGAMAPEGPVMQPEQAIEILQQSLEPEELVILSEIRETVALQGQVSDEQKMFLKALMSEPMIAQAIEVYLTAEVVADEGPQQGAALTESAEVF